jgi:hypothetical protein
VARRQRALAFQSNIPGACCEHVYTVNPDGTDLKLIFSAGNGPLAISEYSPDGATILVNSSNLGACTGGNPILALADNGTPQNNLVLLDDPLSTGDVTGSHCTRDGAGVYSYDGTRIAFGRTDSLDASRNGVWVMNADGSTKVRAAAATDPTDIRWSPDGTELSYQDLGTNYVVTSDGLGIPTPSVLVFPPSPGSISPSVPSGNGPATPSPDGAKKLFLHCCYADTGVVPQVNVANANGSNVQRITTFTKCPGGPFCNDPTGATELTNATWQPIVAHVAIGETDLGPAVDFNPAGVAEAFSAKAKAGVALARLSVYVAGSSTATTLIAGIYADSGSNHPGSLLAQGTLAGAPVAGAWNTVMLPSVSISAGTRYWIAILTPPAAGTLRFRDFCCGSTGSSPSEISAQTTLTSLPGSWHTGTRYPHDGPLTAWGG